MTSGARAPARVGASASCGRTRTRACNRRNTVRIRSVSNDDDGRTRRDVLAAVALAPLMTLASPAIARGGTPTVEERFAAARGDVRKLMAEDPDFGPTMVRLAWHSSGTYDRMSRTGGSGGGTIRFREELAHGGNAGLDAAIRKLEPIHERRDGISWADLIAFVGVVAIEEMGGPKLKFSYGRVDEMDPGAVTPDGRLPDADKGDGPGPKTRQGLRDVFYRMGFNDREIVALSGAHALGRCHANASGYEGPWSGTPLLFNNSYFVLLKGLKWEPDDTKAKFQYTDPSGQLMMLPSDIALIEDEKFKPYVLEYAKSQTKFFEDFAAAFEKLETLGTSGLTPLNA